MYITFCTNDWIVDNIFRKYILLREYKKCVSNNELFKGAKDYFYFKRKFSLNIHQKIY